MDGYVGDLISIKCEYDKHRANSRKYFCKGVFSFDSDTCIETQNKKGQWHSQGGFSISDNEDRGFFEVIMRDLTKNDEGTYWCCVEGNEEPDKYTKIELKVKEGE